MSLDHDKKAAMSAKHALMTTYWSCTRCGKRQPLMLLEPKNWDRLNPTMCNNCYKSHKVKHRQVLKV